MAVLLLAAGKARRAVGRRRAIVPHRAVTGELALAVVVLGVTSVLISLPSPRSASRML